jgi:hypothetical protein
MWWLIQRLTNLATSYYNGSSDKPQVIQPLQEANPILINRLRQRYAVAKIEMAWLAYSARKRDYLIFDKILDERIAYWTH